MVERLGALALGVLAILGGFGFVVFARDFSRTLREIQIRRFGEERIPSSGFGYLILAFVLILLGASLIAQGLSG
jgi:hypothetical protein